MKDSKIEWCHHTFNPWWGCTKVSGHPGCAHCYAEAFSKRTGRAKWGKGEQRVLMSDSYWLAPLKWNAAAKAKGVRERVFCASMADVFDEEVSDEWRWRLFGLIANCDQLDWLLLTKRPHKARAFLEDEDLMNAAMSEGEAQKLYHEQTGEDPSLWFSVHFPLPNVQLGMSVSNQKTFDDNINFLTASPAAARFISYEPALGHVDFNLNAINHGMKLIDWIIVGGESGPGARPFDVEWARSTIKQCRGGHAAPFVKQLGRHPTMRVSGVPSMIFLDDKKGGTISEWTGTLEDLRVREFPTVHSPSI